MGSVEIPDPVEGWNPVPGDPDSMVWWDGSSFTHEAVREANGWEIVGDDASPVVATVVRGVGTRRQSALGLANVSRAITVLSWLWFVNLFGFFLDPIAIVLALRARARAGEDRRSRRRVNVALTVAVVSLAMCFLLIPLYTAIGDGL